MEKIGIFIPARYKSVRFPGKLLQKIGDKTIIQLVYEQAKKNKYTNEIIIVTDNEKIKEEAEKFCDKIFMTPEECKSGSERIGWAIKNYKLEYEIVVNLQGDEPLINPETINKGVELLLEDREVEVGTIITKFKNKEEIENPNFVKVVLDKNNFALYFSRSKIPYVRDKDIECEYYKHIGIYIFRKNFLLKYLKLAEGKLEQIEKLEQLRILENGYKIKIGYTEYDTIGIDTYEDYQRIKEKISKGDNYVIK
ncbi:MAG TPA: 3-deoxy-manno-octulosonate cytidylyltransferase [bacterium]|nr:3-deoxy-manno-octulosonate cytidylyltransferase [bacterium]HOL47385.1 3-deoxy-manno-octulosonate cytidylyltransferase [bacterium]HPQ18116.1 3-deoxy-manno-octulosonate cytidylyltransferase [bacterium]